MKDQKLGSSRNQESHTIEPQNKQDKAPQDVTLGPGTKISRPSHDNAPNSNQQQHPHIVQWPYTTPNATEQLMAESITTQAPPPGFLNQWQQQQLPHSQQSQVFAESTSPFWQPQLFASGSPFPGANMCYPVGYTFPGFPGPCDPSFWLGQMHQLQHPYVYNFPGPPGFFSATPAISGCSTSKEHSLQRGITRPTAKLSQKHKSLWDAQAKENAQLWSMVTKLQGEVSDYKDRLKKLEEEVSSLKQKVETPKTKVIGPIPTGTGQPSKRGRPPKRSLASVNALHEPHPREQGRKHPALNQTQLESKLPIFEPVVLKKVDNKEIANHYTARMVQQQINERILNAASNSMMSGYQGQVNQQYQGIQMCGSRTAIVYASGVKVNAEKDKDLKIVNSEQSQPNKVLNSGIGVSAKCIGNTDSGKFGWTSSNDPARDVLDSAHQSFFHKNSLLQQGQKITPNPGWNFANGEDELQDDAIVGSTKDENKEGMGENTSFGTEKIHETKDT